MGGLFTYLPDVGNIWYERILTSDNLGPTEFVAYYRDRKTIRHFLCARKSNGETHNWLIVEVPELASKSVLTNPNEFKKRCNGEATNAAWLMQASARGISYKTKNKYNTQSFERF